MPEELRTFHAGKTWQVQVAAFDAGDGSPNHVCIYLTFPGAGVFSMTPEEFDQFVLELMAVRQRALSDARRFQAALEKHHHAKTAGP